MQKSESIVNLSKALAEYMKEITNPKNTSDNPFFKSKYSPLSEVLNVVRPALAKYGLSVIQNVSGTGDSVSITSLLLHESGEYLEMDALILKPEKANPQGMGSAITYGRRYALSPLVGVSSEDDDDGNAASESNKKISTDKVAELENLIQHKGTAVSKVTRYYQVKSLADLNETQYTEAKQRLSE